MGAIAANGSEAAPSRETILVVEDEVLIRFLLAETLRTEGYGVVEAANGDEALAVLATSTPIDAILTDVNMPGTLDGVALGRRARSARPALKVMVVSGSATSDHAVDAAHAFLAKPYDLQDIVSAIGTLLAARPG
jgi:CheY-like chemotaxis protein